MKVVQVWCCAVEADLQHNSIARQCLQALRTPAGEQHPVRQHCRRSGCRASTQDLADVCQQKRLATRDKDLFHAELRRFTSDPLYALEPEFSSWCRGGRSHATIITTQVAVEVRVEPETRTQRPLFLRRQRS